MVPKKHQAGVKAALQQIASAESERAAMSLRDTFARTCRRPYPKAVERLERDWERMVAYYAFPQEHWKHLRTTNIIESPFATVRLRIGAAKRFKVDENATTLIWKTLLVVEHHFRKLNAPHLSALVYDGKRYRDGIRTITPSRTLRAA